MPARSAVADLDDELAAICSWLMTPSRSQRGSAMLPSSVSRDRDRQPATLPSSLYDGSKSRALPSGYPIRAWQGALAGIALLALIWAGVIFFYPGASFVLLDPRTKTGFEVLLAAASLFAALVLILLPDEAAREPLRWTALGLVILGIGSLEFGFLYPVLFRPLDLQEGMYVSLLVRATSSAALAIGLALRRPPLLPGRIFVIIVAVVTVASLAALVAAEHLPALTTIRTLTEADADKTGPLPGLQPVHWALSIIPLFLAIIAAAGAAVRQADSRIGRWLATALVFFAGSQLHAMFWPAGFNPVFTTSSGLRVAFTIIVTMGVILELRNIAAERAALLEHERLYTRRLEDLAVLRADFTAMVAHEIASPLAGIRRSAELIDPSTLPLIEQRALKTIQTESTALAALVDDVQASARAERDDFRVSVRPVAIEELIGTAQRYAYDIAGDHPIDVTMDSQGTVMADPDRIGQVLRNLLSNAVKFSPPGTTVSLRATAASGRKVRFEVVDRGSGIHPDDMARIFEKFGRGRLPGDGHPGHVPGVGLGLYLSRRIVQACGSELMVASEPNKETRFWFDLERLP